MYKNYFKTLIDKILSLLGMVFLCPVFIVITFALLIDNKGNAFFTQDRPGKNGKIFKIIKFRTMNDKKDTSGNLLSDAERLTFLGSYIRKTSLDELPQLFNVLKGEMSFVGPRPLLIEYLDLYNDTQKRRHDVKPGITGWAQVNGRNAISWEQKFDYDVWYVDNQSFWLDIKILWLTFLKVVKRSDISSSTSSTMEKFTGSKK